ncbi:MAG: MFS transporter [Microbacterium sp.]|jgi:MFS family permease|uniref:Inner membrane protein YbjJ n=3 Tax=Microbacterium ginsengisoli TaxID=400772 RepID=A0A0F0LRW1_9MICO|nr:MULTISPECIES: MFS transporter [Microbacterium]KJL35977.1 Inner membrane protein YbjJ [Microbacterium ginsengisoli]MAL06267.1 MFS transporter [Microbacterium sp.]MBN9208447.1 MFS transporter [Microbacterium ginsengisoli]ODU79799.1 MAG: MFS transporter permease [Microbacterium sp. SCN 71-21]
MLHSTDRRAFVRWRAAIFVVFALSGLSIATWASRVPAIKAALGISQLEIGLLLLGAGIASVAGLSLAPIVFTRIGARRTIIAAIAVFAAGVLVIGVGTDLVHSYAVVLAGLVLFGLGNGAVDVTMNVEGAAIEKQQGTTILPLFHAFFSFGTVIGASLGALAVALGFDVFTHAAVIAVTLVVAGLIAASQVPAHIPADAAPATQRTPWRERLRISLSAWREPRTYAIGVVMLGMAFAEGGANDWLALSVSEGHRQGEAAGAIGLAVFSVSMTAARVLGGPLVDRIGRVATLRILATTATVGMILFVFAPNLPLIFVGAFLWGAGVSMGFPLGMSAAADDPARAAARVSAAATIGYVAFLAGPPLLGFLAEHIGLLPTLLVLVVLVVASGLASGAAKPLTPVASAPRGAAASTDA